MKTVHKNKKTGLMSTHYNKIKHLKCNREIFRVMTTTLILSSCRPHSVANDCTDLNTRIGMSRFSTLIFMKIPSHSLIPATSFPADCLLQLFLTVLTEGNPLLPESVKRIQLKASAYLCLQAIRFHAENIFSKHLFIFLNLHRLEYRPNFFILLLQSLI